MKLYTFTKGDGADIVLRAQTFEQAMQELVKATDHPADYMLRAEQEFSSVKVDFSALEARDNDERFGFKKKQQTQHG